MNGLQSIFVRLYIFRCTESDQKRLAMSAYSITDYLLDKANIQDTVTQLTWCVDENDWDGLAVNVFADQIVIDYTEVSGGEPVHIAGKDQAKAWKEMLRDMKKTQHAMLSVLVDLTRSGSHPETAKAKANVVIALVHKNGTINQNGARYDLGLTRVSITDPLANPWRITYLKAYPSWTKGNWQEFFEGKGTVKTDSF